MMDFTDRHFRYLIRLISRRATLYSEMITTGAVLRGNRPRLLDYSPEEHPVALQLGGDDPAALGACAEVGESWGYDEINLNCGCPSARVAAGAFGAVLMREPHRVAAAVTAMKRAVRVPVTVKHRIGVDALDSYEHLLGFVDSVTDAGADSVVVHARIALLNGISPAENRTIPPLRYPDVWRLKAERPAVFVAINGGIGSSDAIADHLARVDGVMIGRAVAEDPWLFHGVDQRFYGDPARVLSRAEVALQFVSYVERGEFGSGFRPRHALRHLLPLFTGLPGARRWRRTLTEGLARDVPARRLVEEALASVPGAVEAVGFVAKQEVEGRQ